jgi:hypothetical protein
MSAEEDSAVEVGCAAVPLPVIDVVRFAPGGWAIAAGEEASAVSGGEHNPLAGGE